MRVYQAFQAEIVIVLARYRFVDALQNKQL